MSLHTTVQLSNHVNFSPVLASLPYFFSSFPPAITVIIASDICSDMDVLMFLVCMCVFEREWLSQSVCLLVSQSICLRDGGIKQSSNRLTSRAIDSQLPSKRFPPVLFLPIQHMIKAGGAITIHLVEDRENRTSKKCENQSIINSSLPLFSTFISPFFFSLYPYSSPPNCSSS